MEINAWFYVARARLRLWRKEITAAQADLDAAVQSLRDYGMINPGVLPWRPLACMVAAAGGDTERARELIESEIELARQFETPIALGAALRLRYVFRKLAVDSRDALAEAPMDYGPRRTDA